jgi:hypothetical protein
MDIVGQDKCSSYSITRLDKVATQVVRYCKRWIHITYHPATKHYTTLRRTESIDTCFNLWAEVTHEALDGPGGSIAESANCPALYLLTAENSELRKVVER